jgi:hypothetical protein
VDVRFIRSAEALDPDFEASGGLYVTNYETVRDGRLDPSLFTAVSLDEAAILRSYGSKTTQTFFRAFSNVPFRLVATATPSPNRFKELIHYAGFLGVMDTGQALTRFFQRDPSKAGNLTLYPHKAHEFWLWLATWAAFVRRPSDLGHDDAGYDLPPITVNWHVVTAPGSGSIDRDGQGALFRDPVANLSDAAREKRETMGPRVAMAAGIIAADPAAHRIIWHDLEDERRALQASLPEAVAVWGSLDLEAREARVQAFAEGDCRLLATKPSLTGAGTNLQAHCHKAIFLGVGWKFHDWIQAVHRIHRFGQTHPVEIDVILADSEIGVRDELLAKWERHETMLDEMTAIVRRHGLDAASMAAELTRSLGTVRVAAAGEGWEAVHEDCVRETRAMADASVDLVVTSIPFSNHYEYTPSYHDFGHTDDDDHFFAQMDHLTPELLRVVAPGRICAVHVKDRVFYGNVTGTGMPTVNPFHARVLDHFRRHGWQYMGMATVITDVVRENNQTYRLGWTEMCKDGTKMGFGSPEYILVFRRLPSDTSRAYADLPVVREKSAYSRARWQIDAHGFWRSSGDRHLSVEDLCAMPPQVLARAFTADSLTRVYDYETHVKVGEALELRGALPATFMAIAPGSWHPEVWHDVNRMRTLNGEQAAKGREQHVCPLQFDIVDRLIERYSNPGELVYDPFGGLMTVPVRALMKGRRGKGCELHPGYWADGVKYLEATEREIAMPSLFDLIRAEEAA